MLFFFRLGKKIESTRNRRKRLDLISKGLLIIGRKTYGVENINFFSYRGSEAHVTIGSFCSIAPEVKIITGGIHPPNWIALYPLRIRYQQNQAYEDGMPTTRGHIEIGHDVWIGTGVTILSGVKIGNGSIVAANSVVTKNVPAYSIVAGIPAKPISFRFDKESILELEKIKWWNWNDERIIKSINLLSSDNINEFIKQNI